MNAFREWGTFLKFGIPGMLMTCLDWWAFEFLTLITAKLPHPETAMAANMACGNIVVTPFSVRVHVVESMTIHQFVC